MSSLVDKIKTNAVPGHRYVVAISGAPGSGKTTIAAKITNQLIADGRRAAQIPMDGFHYTRNELDQMEDPVKAHRYRGAPFTFDLPKIKEFAEKLHSREPLIAPTFDHARKDPDADGTVIEENTDIIIFEGNYLLLDIDGWEELAEFWDDRWLLVVDEPILRERLAKRHLKAGLVGSIGAGYERADFNDIPNGRLLMAHCGYDLEIRENS